MGAGASRPPQPPEEGEPRRAVTSELGLSSHLGRARQDCRSRWPSTYRLAVRQARDAFVLVRPRTNLGWRRRRATQRGHRAGVPGSEPRAAAAGRRGRPWDGVGDSRRNSVRGGSEKRAGEVAGPTWASPLGESRGARSPLARRGSARGAMVGLRGAVRGRCARLPPEAESLCWFVYFRKVLHLKHFSFLFCVSSPSECNFLFLKSGRRVLLGSGFQKLGTGVQRRDSLC